MILTLDSSSQNNLMLDEEKNYSVALLDIYTSGLTPGAYELQWNMICRDETNLSQCVGLMPIGNDESHKVFAPRHLSYHKLRFRNIAVSELKFRSLVTEKFIKPKNFYVRIHIIESNGLFRHIQ